MSVGLLSYNVTNDLSLPASRLTATRLPLKSTGTFNRSTCANFARRCQSCSDNWVSVKGVLCP
jgi:hypothetical protein